MTRKEKAIEYFKEGYNCSQSIVLTFSDIIPAEKSEMVKLAAPFGGGMGRLREVCGALSGVFMVLGLLYGYDTPETGEKKAELYARVQEIALEFEDRRGTIVCRELMGLDVRHDDPTPQPRSADFYDKRPCAAIIGEAAQLLDEYLQKNPIHK